MEADRHSILQTNTISTHSTESAPSCLFPPLFGSLLCRFDVAGSGWDGIRWPSIELIAGILGKKILQSAAVFLRLHGKYYSAASLQHPSKGRNDAHPEDLIHFLRVAHPLLPCFHNDPIRFLAEG
ncbi:MAG TPA: hypothetical protein VFX11_03620 [Candidatus Kapabacteria bacterium]|nr:hypothetical protein [Candidatus Kapabacteria bacterium]